VARIAVSRARVAVRAVLAVAPRRTETSSQVLLLPTFAVMRNEPLWTNPLAWLLWPIYAGLWILIVGGFWIGHTLSCMPSVRRGDFASRWRDRPDPNTAEGWARVAVGAFLIISLTAVAG
jgi:hypothetical protein